MTGVEHMHLSARHIPAIRFRLCELERAVILAPDHQQARLRLAHPRLPRGVGVDIRAVVVEEVALNLGLAGLAEEGKLVGPEIWVIAFHVGIVPDMARPRRRQRQESGAQRALVGGAIGPKRSPRLPIWP